FLGKQPHVVIVHLRRAMDREVVHSERTVFLYLLDALGGRANDLLRPELGFSLRGRFDGAKSPRCLALRVRYQDRPVPGLHYPVKAPSLLVAVASEDLKLP